MDLASEMTDPQESKRIVKFNSISVSKALIALAILALLTGLSFVGFTITNDNLTPTDCFRLMWLSGCSIILTTGLVYLNLTGQAEIESAGSTPLTQLLLANLYLIVCLGLVLFFLSLAFF
jgi:hypothetical protein